MVQRLLVLNVILAVLMCQYTTAQEPSTAPAPPAPKLEGSDHQWKPIVGPGDSVLITALNAEEISKTWRVGSGGDLKLPMLGKISVSGMTIDELEETVSTRLAAYVRNPQVAAHLEDSKSWPVTVSGEVAKPGVIYLSGPKPLYAVLVDAGGLTAEAGDQVHLSRSAEAGVISHPDVVFTATDHAFARVTLSTADVTKGYGDAAMLVVQANDHISVEKLEQKPMVYIAGAVNRPGGIELVKRETVSITQAVAMAGGLTVTAAAKKTLIRHINRNGVETAQATINLKKILNGKAKDLELSVGDVVIIPSSSSGSYIQSATTAAMTTGIYMLGRL